MLCAVHCGSSVAAGSPFPVNRKRRFDTGKEQPRDQEPNPDHEAKQADAVYRRKPTDTPLATGAGSLKERGSKRMFSVKKITRKMFASPIVAGNFAAGGLGVLV